MNKSELAIFEGRKLRRMWDKNKEKWWFSVTDMVLALIDSADPLAYWRKLKQRLKEEGNESVTRRK